MYQLFKNTDLRLKTNYLQLKNATGLQCHIYFLGLPFWKILQLFAHFLPPLLCQYSYLKGFRLKTTTESYLKEQTSTLLMQTKHEMLNISNSTSFKNLKFEYNLMLKKGSSLAHHELLQKNYTPKADSAPKFNVSLKQNVLYSVLSEK